MINFSPFDEVCLLTLLSADWVDWLETCQEKSNFPYAIALSNFHLLNRRHGVLWAAAHGLVQGHSIWRRIGQQPILEGRALLVLAPGKGTISAYFKNASPIFVPSPVALQWKYRIEATEKVAAVAGLYGKSVAVTSTYCGFVNTKGCRNTNKPGDLHVWI